ncbi:SNF2 family N-terminal domain-containing protein [Aspergillus crustosus]
MAEVAYGQASIPDAELLAAAKQRRNRVYGKQVLASARLAAGQENELINHAEQSSILPASTFFPDLPELIDPEIPTIPEDVVMSDANTIDAEDGEEYANFKYTEKWFNELTNPTIEDRVRYNAAKRKVDIQQRILESRRLREEKEKDEEEEDEASEDGLFCGQQEVPVPIQPELDPNHPSFEPVLLLQETLVPAVTTPTNSPVPVTKPRARKRQNRISAQERRRSMQMGFEPVKEKLQVKNKIPGSVKKSGAAATTGPKPKAKERPKKGAPGRQPDGLASLQENVIEQAHASAALPTLQNFTGKNKQDLIAQLLASISSENQEEAKSDLDLIKQAVRKFNHRVLQAVNGNNGYKMKGLKTNMYNYQVLGCAFMRERENSPDEPRGGLLCDVMGIGKTFEALVNIVDGSPADPSDPIRTTLLVVPSHLVKHWVDQIRAHCDAAAIGEVVQHHAQTRIETMNVVESLQKFSVIITTYDEVRRSYPTFSPKKEIADEDDLWDQWMKEYDDRVGPLHQINFLRIVLDEAHIIKNRKSSVSLAVRALTGRHKWVLSGTPVMNSIEEFYPLFDFIGVPDVQQKGYTHFMGYYCSDGDGKKRLANLVRTYMIRRTYSSRLFSMPIIKLPDIRETNTDVRFSEAEWVIYEAIQEILIQEINSAGKAPDFVLAQCRCCLTLILRLRMFCSHLLTVQRIVKYLLGSSSLMKDLKRLSREEITETSRSSAEIVRWLLAVKKDYKFLVEQKQTEQLDQAENNHLFRNDPNLIKRFQEYVSKLQADEDWVQVYEMMYCARCGNQPDRPVAASCLHQYCEECYCELYQNAEEDDAKRPESERSESVKPVCALCTLPIKEAARFDYIEHMDAEQQPTAAERIQALSGNKGGQNSSEAEQDEDRDWILACGAKMPSAKLNKIRNIIKDWKKKKGVTKIVLFSQFTDFVRILASMCEDEKWKYRCMTGQLSIRTRHKNLEDFKTDSDITILIVSLHTGGTGLDMTVAHKCILVDLWWNEAIQYQAFCRLLRHGQTQNVECVKLVVQDSIDSYMLELQSRKAKEIDGTMGDDIMKKRDTLVDLLKLFADISKDEKGRLTVKSRNRRGALKASLSAAKESRAQSDLS